MNRESILKRIGEKTVLPVIAAPMFLVSGPDLVIASCKNGVISSFPAPNARTIECLEEWMKQISESLLEECIQHPNRKVAPWAANIITHQSYDRFEQELELIQRYQPPIVITALGSPARVVDAVHSYGGLVFADVNSVHFAKKAAQANIDGLILVSSGAGGHTGTMTGFAFVEAVRQFWDGIIILAGGISSGKGILAAQALGADLVYMGTSFISAEESMAQQAYKEMVVEAECDDILMTNAFTGVHANMLIPSIKQAGLIPDKLQPKETIDFSSPQGESKAWRDIWSAGHGVGATQMIQPVASIIKQFQKEYEQAQYDLITTNQWKAEIQKERVK
ncbi:nitronate monooxygenase [Psychrobacillus psychrotolerans]|uniref:Probable nitronate monooxygenase n=1 Tax=Psychrobacillus psychrotolerans TaxID=126156 RepID=A0A1I6AW12_9BACI|nr:nitronate monooxygenase [Psychrobacillus psychrotolerans]SFQ72856.1 nitronate monooxygenase [Psychrobacillus psychrotolerans]